MVFDNFYAGKRVLVTGDSGFKGPWLCEWLVGLGADVLGIGLEPNTTPSLFDALAMEERIAHEYLDVRSFEDLRGYVRRFQPDLVFHLAAQSLVRRSYREPLETIATNVLGTAHLLAAVDDARVSGASLCPVIVVTSDKCYENDGLRLEPFKESDPMGGHDLYSASKGAAELIVHAWRESFGTSNDSVGLNAIATCRAGNVIGGGDWAEDRVVPDCFRAIWRSEPIQIRNPRAIRPWQHVLEPLSGYLLVGSLLSSRSNAASSWNFGPGPNSERAVSDLCSMLVAKVGRGEWQSHYEEDAPGEAVHLSLNIEKADRELDWRPVWDFEEAVSATVDWYERYLTSPSSAIEFTQDQIRSYVVDAQDRGLSWAVSDGTGVAT